MDKWYISVQTKAKGPYTDLQIRKKIQEGEVNASTLSYREGDSDWRPLERQDIWNPEFVPKEGPQVRDSKDWVLLVESPLKKGDFQQQGPFSQEEVKEKVETGEVHLKDFFWKPGMDSWTPLFESSEMGLPRKEKITFKEEKKKIIKSDELEDLSLNQKKDLGLEPLESLAPIEPLEQKEEEPPVYKPRFIKRLPPLADPNAEKKEIAAYLALVLLFFLGSFYLGYRYNKSLVYGLGSLGEKITTYSQSLLPAPAKASYVLIRELPVSKNTLLMKTDAGTESSIEVSVLDSQGKLMGKTKVPTNENGEAFLNMKDFDLDLGKTYVVQAQVSSLKAQKSYLHTR